MVEPVACVHCGAVTKHPVYKTINGQSLAFCCGGCVEVYEMLHEEGLDSGQGVPEMASKSTPAQQAETAALSQTITYHVEGMTCANCVATVTRQLRSVPGVMEASVILETESTIVKMNTNQVSTADLKRAVEKAGYGITPAGGPR